MKAVLVGSIHNDKLYYITDAGPGEKDGIIERQNGSSIKVNFISTTSKVSGLKKFRTTRFHRFLWDKPKNVVNGSWYKTFVTKEKEIPEKSLEQAVILTSVGEARSKIKTKDARALLFLANSDDKLAATSTCCGEMLKSVGGTYSFGTQTERKEAWMAMKIMRNLEGK